MFGLEKKKTDSQFFLFDLEKELEANENKAKYIKLIEKKILYSKTALKTGGSKEYLEQLMTLLNGYHALTIVMSRSSKQTQVKK